ncbi:unnamed protein product [Linum tenue]|uniref:Uncharacterized protein n=1 Tax=Linum tenue TaxID=586396 RepID=A0AAV0MVQ4_9ROSI|nr:unnamed protein product [Linum tenue]
MRLSATSHSRCCSCLMRRSNAKKKRKKLSAVPHRVCDKVAEGVVLCLEELFQKSRFGFVDQQLQLDTGSHFFCRLIEKLPKVVLGGKELAALFHAQQLLAVIYYSGPRFMLDHLQNPMCAVSRELEILGRHQHPKLTTPFLKVVYFVKLIFQAIAEISKASKSETSSLPSNAELYLKDVKSKASWLEKKARAETSHNPDGESDSCQGESEQWVSIMFKWSESKRYRRTVGSIAASCLSAATPVLASMEQTACLVALDIVQDGVSSLAKVEEAYQHEKETKEVIEEVVRSYSIYELHDTMDAADEGIDENRLLPAMNKIWPNLISCVRNKNPVVPHRQSMLMEAPLSSPFQKKPVKEERTPLLLPYRSNPSTDESSSMAEISNLKVQVAVLNMISDLARNKRSSTALEVVLKKVSGLVVGIACNGGQ